MFKENLNFESETILKAKKAIENFAPKLKNDEEEFNKAIELTEAI